MPELPEIETIKLQLQKVLIGQKLLRSDFPEVNGKTVKEIKRLGKVLLINFGSGLDLGFHFKMTGQLVYDDGKKRVVGGHPTEDFVNKMPSKHTRAIFYFEKGILYFNDQRMFGWIMLNPKFVDKLGPEPLEMKEAEFIKRLSRLRKPIKIAVMDQEVISGVGNIYANDACWEAKTNPRRLANTLTSKQYHDLYVGVVRVLREGIKYGGATAADAKYIDLHGLGGHYQEHFRVYDREGEMCHRGDGIIHRFELGGRGTYYCPKCQT